MTGPVTPPPDNGDATIADQLRARAEKIDEWLNSTAPTGIIEILCGDDPKGTQPTGPLLREAADFIEGSGRHMPASPLIATIQAVDRTVDMLSITAAAAGRILALGPDDTPRLLVSASCRLLEQLIEQYGRRQEAAEAGRIAWDLADRGRRRQEILTACSDLIVALTAGLERAEQIRASVQG